MEGSTAVIARRRYYIEQPGGDLELTLSIERPIQEEPYYRFGYSFTGAEQINRSVLGAVDEIDALVCALQMAGTDLEHINEHKYGGRLQWDWGTAKGSLPTIRDRDHWPWLPKQSIE